MHCLCCCTFIVVLLMSFVTKANNSKERIPRLVKSTEAIIENAHNSGKKRNLKNLAYHARPPYKGLMKRTKSLFANKNSKGLPEFVKDADNTTKNICTYNNTNKHKEVNNSKIQETKENVEKVMNMTNSDKNTTINFSLNKTESELNAGRLENTEKTNETDKTKIKFKIGDIDVAMDTPENALTEEQMMEFTHKMYRNLLHLNVKPGPLRNANYSFSNNYEPDELALNTEEENYKKNSTNLYTAVVHDQYESSQSNDSWVAEEVAKKVRVLCWVMTEASRHETNAAHIKATWGRRCNKLVFMSSAKDSSLPAVNLHVSDGRDHLWEKTMEAFSYIHKQYRNKAEWFLKADDDTYVILENLRYMLAEFDSTQPLYFGCRFKPYAKQGYMSGGAGYVLSRAALDRLVRAFQIPHMCSLVRSSAEDVQLGKCLGSIGVRAVDTRDSFGRGRFFPFSPREHIFPNKKMGWYFDYLYYPSKEGLECCSNRAISFHGLEPREMYMLDYLIYHLRPHSNHLLDTESRSFLDTERRGQDTRNKILPVAELQFNTID